jgi:nitrogenase-stabilizing/protective protein
MSVLSNLEKLHSAEDFFSCLKVDFDPAMVRVARLHILKRMGKYLAEKDFAAAKAASR